MKKKNSLIAGIVILILLVSLVIPDYTYASKSLKDIRKERTEIKNKLSENENEIVAILTEMKELDVEINILEQSFQQNELALKEVEQDMTTVQLEIEELEEKIESRFDILSERAKSYQENGGNISFLEVVLGSKNFTDFISRVNAVNKITESDAAIIEEQKEAQAEVEKKLLELENLENELKEMEQLINEQKNEAKKMKMSLEEKENELKNKKSELKKEDRNLAKLEADLFDDSNNIINTSNSNGIFAWPTVGGYISSPFGSRWGSTHKGIDIARTDRSTSPPILAAESGVVERVSSGGGYGNMLIINHGNGLKTLYAHLSTINVKTGQKVERGEKIGVMGTTGNSTGIHLHFEVHENGTVKNPIPYLK